MYLCIGVYACVCVNVCNFTHRKSNSNCTTKSTGTGAVIK